MSKYGPIHFLYQGFSQISNLRSYSFAAVSGNILTTVFSINVDLELLLRNRISIQECPGFCLSLLEKALLDGPIALDTYRQYSVAQHDFVSVIHERQARADAKASKKPPRQHFRKRTDLVRPSPAQQP